MNICAAVMVMKGGLFFCLLCVVTRVSGNPGHGSICAPNERFLACGGCQKTCQDPAPNCSSVCRTGCYCNEDEVRNSTGHCVKLADCPSAEPSTLHSSEPRLSDFECPADEEYRSCEPCNKTCDNPNPVCPAQCARGCFCREGLVRDVNGRCVKVEDCSARKKNDNSNFIPTTIERKCGIHQVYENCKTCERTCSYPSPVCSKVCRSGCFCFGGYLRAPNGDCVMLRDCPKAEITMNTAHEPSIEDCSPDEVYLSCGWCEPTCSDPHPNCPHDVCTRGCLCRPPLIRHHSGHCVPIENCHLQRCTDPNEEYVCRYGCEARCDARNCTSRLRRCTLGCHCKLGLLRDATGLCVTPDFCTNTSRTLNFNTSINMTTKTPLTSSIVKQSIKMKLALDIPETNITDKSIPKAFSQNARPKDVSRAVNFYKDLFLKDVNSKSRDNTIGFPKDSLMTGKHRCTDCPCVYSLFRC